MRAPLLACLLLCSGLAHADVEVLVDRVPKGADPTVLIAVIKQALIGRQWTVTEVSLESVSATIERPPVLQGRIRINLHEHTIVYEGSAARRTTSGPQNGVLLYERPLPPVWVRNLRNDISLALATVPDR